MLITKTVVKNTIMPHVSRKYLAVFSEMRVCVKVERETTCTFTNLYVIIAIFT